MHAVFRLPKPSDELPEGVDVDRLFIRDQTREVNFVLESAATLSVQVFDSLDKPLAKSRVYLSGKELPPASSVIEQGTTDDDGKLSFANVPAGFDWWFEVNLGERRYARSLPLKFAAGNYKLVLRQNIEDFTGHDVMELTSVTDALGNPVFKEVISDDPYFRVPLGEVQQEQGRNILRKVHFVNQFWLARPPEDVKSYSYEFTLRDKDSQLIAISNPAAGSINERRGISYYSAIDYITANPDKAIFRVVDVGENRIELVYSLAERVIVSAGNGVAQTWSGFFSMGVREGTLIIDAKRYAPIEHRTGELTETFSNYVELRDGHYVPLRIQISKYKLDWTFKVHEPGLWLFDHGTTGGKSDSVIARVEHVSINGGE
jgi:hypothetical protein